MLAAGMVSFFSIRRIAMLGLYPYASLNMLIIDPHLLGWLPEITVSGLRAGKAAVSISFFRKRMAAVGMTCWISAAHYI
jgi:hypothetical protein